MKQVYGYINRLRKLLKTKNGFTLIELLAVITIMGILLIIAIPAVNKIIFESRRRTYVNTAKSYITDAANYVKEMEGDYYDPEATYYIDTYCLNLDDNASSPFSKFVESYVVVGFDDIKGKYNYSWFSYDKTGYGVDLVERDKLKKSDVKSGVTKLYKRPLVGKSKSVYLANKENNCVQTRFNYELEMPADYLPVMMSYSENEKFWSYSDKIKKITFQIDGGVSGNIVESWDISHANNGKVNAYLVANSVDPNYYDLYIVGRENLYANENSSKLFYGFSALEEINNIELLDTGRVTNMKEMFYGVSLLKKLDLSKFNTSKVTNMMSMFHGMNNLEFLNIDSFDTSNVTNMNSMFSQCSNLENLNVSNFNTSKVTIMANMFFNMRKVKALDVSRFDTRNVTNMGYMFYFCQSIPHLNLKSFDTKKVKNMAGMFQYCGSLLELDITHFDTSKVTTMYSMFMGMGSIKTLDVSNFDTKNVKNMASMFQTLQGLKELNLGNFDLSSATNISSMFYASSNLEKIDISNFKTSTVQYFDELFYYCGNLKEIDVRNAEFSKIGGSVILFSIPNSAIKIYVKNDDEKNFFQEQLGVGVGNIIVV